MVFAVHFNELELMFYRPTDFLIDYFQSFIVVWFSYSQGRSKHPAN